MRVGTGRWPEVRWQELQGVELLEARTPQLPPPLPPSGVVVEVVVVVAIISQRNECWGRGRRCWCFYRWGRFNLGAVCCKISCPLWQLDVLSVIFFFYRSSLRITSVRPVFVGWFESLPTWKSSLVLPQISLLLNNPRCSLQIESLIIARWVGCGTSTVVPSARHALRSDY
jgi:hypothetical protein